MSIDVFWIVWNPAHGTPTTQHSREKAAKEEAIRLASEHPGSQFFVLQSTGLARKEDPVKWTTIVPF